MKKFAVLLLFAAAAVSAFAADTSLKGYLVDVACAKDDAAKPEWGPKHTKNCLLMPKCEASGYGVMTEDRKVIRFDKAGSEEAKKFIVASTKNNDFKVTVTGSVSGDTMTVTKIELQ
jgi:hypothetical protein